MNILYDTNENFMNTNEKLNQIQSYYQAQNVLNKIN
jgi:hypothetical protein